MIHPLVGCGLNQFTCASGGGCVPLSSVCDDHPFDCQDNSDEINCGTYIHTVWFICFDPCVNYEVERQRHNTQVNYLYVIFSQVVSLNVLLGTVCLLAQSVMVLVTALIQLMKLSVVRHNMQNPNANCYELSRIANMCLLLLQVCYHP